MGSVIGVSRKTIIIFILVLLLSNVISINIGKSMRPQSVREVILPLPTDKLGGMDNYTELIESDKVLAQKIFFKDGYIAIDGGCQRVSEDNYYLKVDDEEYISSALIKELYKLDNQYGLVAKGFPIEGEFLIRTDGIIRLEEYYAELEAEFKKKAEKGDYNDITTQIMEGLNFIWGEVGLRQVEILQPKYMTQRGIRIGSTRDEVQREYGMIGTHEDNVWYTFINNAEYSQGRAYTFHFEKDIVTKITYGWK